jgi:hypothetical protein
LLDALSRITNFPVFENIEESEQLKYFQQAYKKITGEWLKHVRKSERPDYICSRPDGSLVGVEFTLITRDPDDSSWDSILDGDQFMDGSECLDLVCVAIATKGAKLKNTNPETTAWQLPDSSILVLSTPDCPITEIETFLNDDARDELLGISHQSGFSEIWIADHTEVEVFGNVELFGLFPIEFWGCHPNYSRGKPYG